MHLVFAASAAPAAATSGPNWLTFLLSLLGTFVVGTATALLIQLYVVPNRRRARGSGAGFLRSDQHPHQVAGGPDRALPLLSAVLTTLRKGTALHQATLVLQVLLSAVVLGGYLLASSS